MKNRFERTDFTLAAEIIGVCSKNSYSLDEITFRIYKNDASKNRFKIFQIIEGLLRQDALVPQFKNKKLCFRFNNGKD